LKFLVQAFRLMIADEHEKTIPLESIQRPLILFLPVNFPFGLEFVSVEDALSICRLDQAAKIFGLFLVIILHLLINAGANQFADGNFFSQASEREGVGFLAGSGLVMDGKGGNHNLLVLA
jgi:hypothetical protein